ncbi:MAG TPA: ATP-binding protein, partial [Anaerolineales bacterium]
YFMLDEEGTILDVNQAGADLLGEIRSQLAGKPLSRFVYEQDQDSYFIHRRQAYQTKTRVKCELRLLKVGGSLIYAQLEYAPATDSSGQARLLRLIVSDISQRVLLEQSVVKNQTILSAAERLAHLGGWELDVEKDEVIFSEELQRIYGCEKNCYSMKDFLLLAHPDDRTTKREALEKALSGAAPLNFEHRILRQIDRVERFIQVSGEVIFDKTGKPVKIYGASQDVSELKINERSLKTYAAHLENLNRDLESFTFIASHDLQAPLRKILMFGERVKTHLPVETEEEVLDNIGRMQRAAARMQLLISDLLAYSRIPNGILSYKDVDLKEIVGEALDDLDALIKSSGARVEVGELVVLSADPTLMEQLFQNLIGNALKFHEPEKAPVIKIEAERLSPQTVQIRVIDQGIGFDEQNLERIFQPFERLHSSNQYEGTGIGLALCRKIVERHSGSITARSEPGKGATFIVTLPVRQE